MSIFAGALFALAVYALLLYSFTRNHADQARAEALDSLTQAHAAFAGTWETTANIAEHVARQLNGAERNALTGILKLYRNIQPQIGFSLFDRNGERIVLPPLPGEESFDAPPVLHTVRGLVHQAMLGQSVRGFSELRGFLSLTVAVPVRSGGAGVLVAALPLDPDCLETMKDFSRTDIAVIPFTDVNASELSATETVSGTFGRSPLYGSHWTALGSQLAGKPVGEPRTLSMGDNLLFAAIGPLAAPDGTVVGALVTAPVRIWDGRAPIWYAAAAAAAGLALTCLMAFCMHRDRHSLLSSVAGSLSSLLADGQRSAGHGEEGQPGQLPGPLGDSLSRVSRTLRRYGEKLRVAEQNGPAGRRNRDECRRQGGYEDGDSMRLFDSAPVGVFQIKTNGRFIRVNTAFAMLLGYDSPGLLMSECSSFSELFLYGDEIRNPLLSLVEGNERQIVSLRRRDGRVRHYGLMLNTVTSPTGDPSGELEGFLLDRGPEEIAARADRERNYANKQRVSLALLLAATCRQAMGYMEMLGKDPDALTAVESHPTSANQAGTQADAAGRRQLRLGTLAVNAVLSDIYQISLTEAASSPPASVPMEAARFFHSLCRQVLPGMNAKGVSLRCEISRELPPRFSGPAPLLRHALERALLAVTAPVHGGMACISASRDPNAPKSPGIIRVLFSVSWSLLDREAGGRPQNTVNPLENQDYSVTFEARTNPDPQHAGPGIDLGVLEIADEQEVLQYLVRRMHGEVLEGNFTAESRSLRLIVPLSYLGGESAPAGRETDETGAVPDDGAFFLQETGPDSLSPGMAVPLAEVTPAGLAADAAAPALEILALEDSETPDGFPGASSAPDRGLDILLVDDNLNNRLLFSLFLRETRHRITEAHDGQAGVEAFQHGLFDLIFLDMEMPLMDGYQATRIIRALEADNGREPTPIVAMTTYALPEFRRQCTLAGCTDFMSKPFSKVALINLLEAYMQIKTDKAR